MLGRSPRVASIWPDIGVPTAVRLPSKMARFSLPLKAPAAEMAPMPLCARPVAADSSRLASCVSRPKLEKSKRKLSPSASAPVARPVAPSMVTVALRSAIAFTCRPRRRWPTPHRSCR